MSKSDLLQEMIQEIAVRFSGIGDKVLILQASDHVVCCGAYKGKNMVHAALLLYNKQMKKWEIVEGELEKETTALYFAYTCSLLETIDKRLGNAKDEFGIDIDKDFLSR